MKELNTKYDHKSVEEGKNAYWVNSHFFESGRNGGKPFTIVIPPPNVTGKLHLGHALDVTIQDAIIRYKRMQGFDALWVPGMDHAGIATQSKVDKRLMEEGINPREMDRSDWLKRAWEWKEEYAKNIHEQWGKLGLSLDYTKERFTLDEGLSKAVREVFVKLYNEGLIYRGTRMINWDPELMTALSDEEVVYKDIKGAFYHIKYPVIGTDEYLDVATTRPETMFGDMALAVNPEDERYKKYIGKKALLPLVNREIQIIADEHADPEKGTGVVKITPFHDPNDYEVGKRHNLPGIQVINKDGTMNEEAMEFSGMDRFECRDALVKKLESEGYLLEVEGITHSVGHSERSGVPIEPYVSKQWFIKMRPLADALLELQKDKNKKVKFLPSRYEKVMNHWLEITYDWCISRQLWWGHQIPAWYKGDEVYVGVEAPQGEGWVQDEDVLDTWFSSALWPFSTLGFPDTDNELFKKYYPTNVLVTGYDIIPFWVNRMAFQGLHFTGERPFEHVYIHGLIRDKLGRKFSKSLGNGVDPMDVIDEYGADALRYYLATSTRQGTDIRYEDEKVRSTWNFINKIWNASRFVMLNLEGMDESKELELRSEDKWILTKLNKTIKEVTKYMDKYEFQNVGSILYNFIWEDFCDNYIEISKGNLNLNTTKVVLKKVLNSILGMLHPLMPFVTEEIYKTLNGEELSIVISEYPKYNKDEVFIEDEELIDDAINFITTFRSVKKEHNIGKEFKVVVRSLPVPDLTKRLLKLDNAITDSYTGSSYEVIYKNYGLTLFSTDKDSLDDAIKKEKEIMALEASIKHREELLSNDNFVSKAPTKLVEQEKEKLAFEKDKLDKLKLS